MLNDSPDFQFRLNLPKLNASPLSLSDSKLSSAEPEASPDPGSEASPGTSPAAGLTLPAALQPVPSLLDSKLSLDPALEGLVLGQAPAPTLSVAFPNVDSLGPGGLLAPEGGNLRAPEPTAFTLETRMAMMRIQLDPLGSLEQSALLSFDQKPTQDLDALKEVLAEISPELAELVRQGGDSAGSPGGALLDQRVNYALGQLLLSFDSDKGGLQEAFCQTLDRLFAGGSPSPADLRLLASYNLSWKQGALFDNLRQQPVVLEEHLGALKVNLSSRRLAGFDTVLGKVQPGLSLTPAEQDLLAAYGLHARQGELVNLIDGQPLSAGQRDLLARAVATLDGSLSRTREMVQTGSFSSARRGALGASDALGGLRIEQTYIRKNLVDRLKSLSPALRAEFQRHKELEATIEINRRKQEAAAGKLSAQDQANHETGTRLERAKTEQAALELESADLEAAETWALSLPPRVSLPEAFAALGPDQRPKVQAALGRLQLGFERDGSLRFSLGQRPATGESLSQLLRLRREGYHKRLIELKAQVGTLQGELARGLEESRRLRREIEQLRAEQAQQLTALASSDADLARHRQELLAMRQDPAQWQALSEAERAEAEALLGGCEGVLSASERLHARLRATQAQVDAALSASLAQDAQLSGLAGLARQLLASLDQQIAASLARFDALASLDRRQAPVAAAARRLCAAADALEARVQLTAKPLYVGIDKLTEAWGELLREARANFDRQFGQALAEASLARHLDADHSRQLKESLDYHLDRLATSKQLSKEQLQHWLSASLEQFRQQLNTIA